MLREVRTAAELLNWRKVGVRLGDCPVCGRTGFVKLDDYEMAVRCLRCRSSAATLSFVSVLKGVLPDLSCRHVYELSSRGPLVGYLRRHAGKLTLSEYFDDVPPGQYKAGVQCQDVQQLTYPDDCFDVCTSTEVFEHVPRDLEGFRELHRVLKPGGLLLFTVPMDGGEKTVERARLANGRLEHLSATGISWGPHSRFRGRSLLSQLRNGYSGSARARPASAGVAWSRVRT